MQILVRPHPELSGNCEIIPSRRSRQHSRWLACCADDAIEDIDLEDLAYIDRAHLADRKADEAYVKTADIDVAFSRGKTDRFRYLKIGRGMPDDILTFIANAHC